MFLFKPKCYKFNLIPSCFFVCLLHHSLNRSQNLIFYLQWSWKNNFALTKIFDSLILWRNGSTWNLLQKNMIFKCFNYIFKFDMLINKELVNKFPKIFFCFFQYFCIKKFFLNSIWWCKLRICCCYKVKWMIEIKIYIHIIYLYIYTY